MPQLWDLRSSARGKKREPLKVYKVGCGRFASLGLDIAADAGCCRLQMTGETNCVAFDPGQKHLAVGCRDGSLVLYNLSDGSNSTAVMPYAVTGICFVTDKEGKTQVVTANEGGGISMWNPSSTELVASFVAPASALSARDVSPVGVVSTSGSGSLFAAAFSNGDVAVYEESAASPVVVCSTGVPACRVDAFGDGCTFAIGDSEGER